MSKPCIHSAIYFAMQPKRTTHNHLLRSTNDFGRLSPYLSHLFVDRLNVKYFNQHCFGGDVIFFIMNYFRFFFDN